MTTLRPVRADGGEFMPTDLINASKRERTPINSNHHFTFCIKCISRFLFLFRFADDVAVIIPIHSAHSMRAFRPSALSPCKMIIYLFRLLLAAFCRRMSGGAVGARALRGR